MKIVKEVSLDIKCEECNKRLAKYECLECNSKFCAICEDNFMGDCPQCEPPRLTLIKS